MNDRKDSPGIPSASASSEVADRETAGPTVTQAEIDDVLNDTSMPVEERLGRLQTLATRLGVRGSVDAGADVDPLSSQLSEALNMLAQGGHTYETGISDASEGLLDADRREPYSKR